LMDFNAETLAYTQNSLEEAIAGIGTPPQLEYVQQSVYNLLKAGSGDVGLAKDYDFIYCAGLFDYLSDKACSRLLDIFYQWVRPGGRVLVTNVHPANTALYLMEHILEWHLIYRDEQQLLDLVPSERVRRSFADQTGLNVFLELEKPGEHG
jgi:extracellular factor (EF) 3-hydroxypalmitic acid methyl ester biosynthesis protein